MRPDAVAAYKCRGEPLVAAKVRHESMTSNAHSEFARQSEKSPPCPVSVAMTGKTPLYDAAWPLSNSQCIQNR